MVLTLTNQLLVKVMWLTPGQTFLNRANLGLEVMHERNAHNFPLDLAAADTTPVALTAPSIG